MTVTRHDSDDVDGVDVWQENLQPLTRAGGESAAGLAHVYLRGLMLDGSIPPGTEINQVTLAERLGISRTPVREAIRMLQEEGLVFAEPWKRARVVGFDPAQLESIYVQRIMIEGAALALTVPKFSEGRLDQLEAMARRLSSTGPIEAQSEEWNVEHKEFHLALVEGASSHLLRTIQSNMERAEHPRNLYQYRGPRSSLRHVGEHEHIISLARRRDADGAASELAAHLARTALTLIGQLTPHYDPALLRISLRHFRSPSVPDLLEEPR